MMHESDMRRLRLLASSRDRLRGLSLSLASIPDSEIVSMVVKFKEQTGTES